MAARYDLFVRRGGGVEFVYADDLAALFADGDMTVVRASHVEPRAGGGWEADLGPVGGPVLGPFPTRGAALVAEAEWLRERLESRGTLRPEGGGS